MRQSLHWLKSSNLPATPCPQPDLGSLWALPGSNAKFRNFLEFSDLLVGRRAERKWLPNCSLKTATDQPLPSSFLPPQWVTLSCLSFTCCQICLAKFCTVWGGVGWSGKGREGYITPQSWEAKWSQKGLPASVSLGFPFTREEKTLERDIQLFAGFLNCYPPRRWVTHPIMPIPQWILARQVMDEKPRLGRESLPDGNLNLWDCFSWEKASWILGGCKT